MLSCEHSCASYTQSRLHAHLPACCCDAPSNQGSGGTPRYLLGRQGKEANFAFRVDELHTSIPWHKEREGLAFAETPQDHIDVGRGDRRTRSTAAVLPNLGKQTNTSSLAHARYRRRFSPSDRLLLLLPPAPCLLDRPLLPYRAC